MVSKFEHLKKFIKLQKMFIFFMKNWNYLNFNKTKFEKRSFLKIFKLEKCSNPKNDVQIWKIFRFWKMFKFGKCSYAKSVRIQNLWKFENCLD
jgi:hypothetical protein